MPLTDMMPNGNWSTKGKAVLLSLHFGLPGVLCTLSRKR